jgi:hypothetical protein
MSLVELVEKDKLAKINNRIIQDCSEFMKLEDQKPNLLTGYIKKTDL